MPLRSHLLNTAPKIEIFSLLGLMEPSKSLTWAPFFDHVVLNLEGKSDKDARAKIFINVTSQHNYFLGHDEHGMLFS